MYTGSGGTSLRPVASCSCYLYLGLQYELQTVEKGMGAPSLLCT
jgi:hypothetical protein